MLQLPLNKKMPASELEWSSLSRGPIYQIFGTKRKAIEENVMEVHSCTTESNQHSKRLCQWSQQQPSPIQTLIRPRSDVLSSGQDPAFADNNNSLSTPPGMIQPINHQWNNMEMNHNSPSMQDQQQMYEQQQISHPAISQVMCQQPPRVPSPWPSHQPIHHSAGNQGDHIMDINGETYSAILPTNVDMEAAQSGMESDCVPDPQQYQTKQPSPKSEFCDNFCGSGERSPVSGRVRCYCKPSWEGMLDMKPYLSDVY